MYWNVSLIAIPFNWFIRSYEHWTNETLLENPIRLPQSQNTQIENIGSNKINKFWQVVIIRIVASIRIISNIGFVTIIGLIQRSRKIINLLQDLSFLGRINTLCLNTCCSWTFTRVLNLNFLRAMLPTWERKASTTMRNLSFI